MRVCLPGVIVLLLWLALAGLARGEWALCCWPKHNVVCPPLPPSTPPRHFLWGPQEADVHAVLQRLLVAACHPDVTPALQRRLHARLAVSNQTTTALYASIDTG